MSTNNTLNIPIVEESKLIHDGFIKIRCDLLRMPNDHSYQYYTLQTKASAVIILATTAKDSLVLIEEYRHPTKKIILSTAGGYLEGENEDPCTAARRELFEETGYTAEKFVLMGSAYPYPGISDQKLYYVHAQNARKISEPHLEGSEVLQPIVMTRRELKDAIASGRPLDGNLCTALFFEG